MGLHSLTNNSDVKGHTVQKMLTYGKGKKNDTTLDKIIYQFPFNTSEIKTSDKWVWILVCAL